MEDIAAINHTIEANGQNKKLPGSSSLQFSPRITINAGSILLDFANWRSLCIRIIVHSRQKFYYTAILTMTATLINGRLLYSTYVTYIMEAHHNILFELLSDTRLIGDQKHDLLDQFISNIFLSLLGVCLDQFEEKQLLWDTEKQEHPVLAA